VDLVGEPPSTDAERWSRFVNELQRLGRLKAG
jgi:hypothetical protein